MSEFGKGGSQTNKKLNQLALLTLLPPLVSFLVRTAMVDPWPFHSDSRSLAVGCPRPTRQRDVRPFRGRTCRLPHSARGQQHRWLVFLEWRSPSGILFEYRVRRGLFRASPLPCSVRRCVLLSGLLPLDRVLFLWSNVTVSKLFVVVVMMVGV